MCITFFRLGSTHSSHSYRLVLAFNRDESVDRPTLALRQYQEDRYVYAGRDVVSGGTWLGINIRTGILVFLTNYRLEDQMMLLSRGKVTYKFVSTSTFQNCKTDQQVDERLRVMLGELAEAGQKYTPFNLVVYNIRSNKCFYLNNIACETLELQEGNHGLSNTGYSMEYPKVEYGLKLFTQIIVREEKEHEGDQKEKKKTLVSELLKLMTNDTVCDQQDPDRSRIFLKPYFSHHLNSFQCTKSTTVIIITHDLQISMKEVTYSESPGTEELLLSLIPI